MALAKDDVDVVQISNGADKSRIDTADGSDSGKLASMDTSLPPEFALATIKKYWGIEGLSASKLGSERDQLFLVPTKDGRKVTIKFSHPSIESEAVNFQTEMVQHMNRVAPDVPVQHVIPSISGDFELRLDCHGYERTARVVSYLEGELLRLAPGSVLQRYNVGVMAARVTKALSSFKHPAQHHVLLWDIQHASVLRQYIKDIEDPEKRAKLEFVLSVFESKIKPRLPYLRSQVVHDDYNLDNVLIDPEHPEIVTGILDFDDAVYTAIVNDAAVGASYQLNTCGGSLLDGALAFIKGYDSQVPLTDEEIELLFDIMLTRLYVCILQYRSRAAQSPENSTHLLRNEPRAWSLLDGLLKLKENEGRSRVTSFRTFEIPK